MRPSAAVCARPDPGLRWRGIQRPRTLVPSEEHAVGTRTVMRSPLRRTTTAGSVLGTISEGVGVLEPYGYSSDIQGEQDTRETGVGTR